MQLVFRLEFNTVVYQFRGIGGARHRIGLACVMDRAHEPGTTKNDEHVVANELYRLEFGRCKLVAFFSLDFDGDYAVFTRSVCLDEWHRLVTIGVFVNRFFVVQAVFGYDRTWGNKFELDITYV